MNGVRVWEGKGAGSMGEWKQVCMVWSDAEVKKANYSISQQEVN